MGIVILISSVVVNGQESQDFPVKMDDLYEKADKNCSILQGRSEWVVDDQSMNNETARNKRQIACCYGNQYPIITLPSCSIPYTIINGTPVDNFLGNINHDVSGYPTCCSYSDNTQGLPKKETAGLMRGSGNGEGGNTIISNVNILAGPSCEDPCGSQNACMLSHSGNGDGGNKIVANANYINGGNLLCCSGNGRGGNCIRTMVNIVGGNSARVLSSCDGQLLKHMCDFLATDFCTTKTANVSDPTTEPTTEPTTVPTTEPTTEPITKPTTESTQTTEPISEPPQTTELNTEPTNTSTPLTEPPKTDETPSQVRRSAGPNITKEDRLDTTDGITPVTSQLCGPHTFLRQPNYCVPRCPPPNYFLFPSKNTYC
ncbi:hypothetical protein GE061_019774 [Apolygus lucorum]|uniref:Uncharacterized protein n=1 Tax=Apolygus lucorum TaxID=248454 RepID=A0A8S9XBC2_APOLU|nr:hypothetical protein GE061_019774 [Apolygus lucorum]